MVFGVPLEQVVGLAQPPLTTVLILGVATWRLTSLLVKEDGPFTMFGHLRYRLGVRQTETGVAYGTSFFGQVLACVWCSSVWVGMGLTVCYCLSPFWTCLACLPFALSGLALIVQRVVTDE